MPRGRYIVLHTIYDPDLPVYYNHTRDDSTSSIIYRTLSCLVLFYDLYSNVNNQSFYCPMVVPWMKSNSSTLSE